MGRKITTMSTAWSPGRRLRRRSDGSHDAVAELRQAPLHHPLHRALQTRFRIERIARGIRRGIRRRPERERRAVRRPPAAHARNVFLFCTSRNENARARRETLLGVEETRRRGVRKRRLSRPAAQRARRRSHLCVHLRRGAGGARGGGGAGVESQTHGVFQSRRRSLATAPHRLRVVVFEEEALRVLSRVRRQDRRGGLLENLERLFFRARDRREKKRLFRFASPPPKKPPSSSRRLNRRRRSPPRRSRTTPLFPARHTFVFASRRSPSSRLFRPRAFFSRRRRSPPRPPPPPRRRPSRQAPPREAEATSSRAPRTSFLFLFLCVSRRAD